MVFHIYNITLELHYNGINLQTTAFSRIFGWTKLNCKTRNPNIVFLYMSVECEIIWINISFQSRKYRFLCCICWVVKERLKRDTWHVTPDKWIFFLLFLFFLLMSILVLVLLLAHVTCLPYAGFVKPFSKWLMPLYLFSKLII